MFQPFRAKLITGIGATIVVNGCPARQEELAEGVPVASFAVGQTAWTAAASGPLAGPLFKREPWHRNPGMPEFPENCTKTALGP